MVVCSGQAERRCGAVGGLSTALGRIRLVSKKFLALQGRAFREAPSVEPILPGAISV